MPVAAAPRRSLIILGQLAVAAGVVGHRLGARTRARDQGGGGEHTQPGGAAVFLHGDHVRRRPRPVRRQSLQEGAAVFHPRGGSILYRNDEVAVRETAAQGGTRRRAAEAGLPRAPVGPGFAA